MARPIEQRSGSQSIDSLIEQGFFAPGPIIENNVDIIKRNGKEHKVRPISVTDNIGKPEQRVITVFKPTRR